jgi:MoxR-like ATPase
MKQRTNKGAKSDAQDWKAVEKEVADASSAATKDRLNKPASDYSAEFAKLGMSMPAVGVSATSAKDLSAEAQALRVMQREDGLQGLKARASHSRVVSELTGLRSKVLRDEKLAPGTRDGMLKTIRERLDGAGKEYAEALQRSPEGFMAANVSDLRAYRRQYTRGRIVETQYVGEKKGEILQALGSARMCFISGETGTGKTEVARIVAREFSGKEELVVRGYAGIGSSEIYGHMTLTDSAEKRMENARKEIDLAERAYKERFPDASETDLAAVARGVLAKGGVTTTEYILGAVYQAAKEGRAVIIDEANYIPPELLASLNDIMTKRPGEKINVQQDGVGPITVQKGFGVIFTGNINPPTGPTAKRYLGRKEFDAAFTDRVPNVSYERLPQAVQGRPSDYALHDKQLFAVAVSTALLPPVRTGADTVEKLESRYGTLFLPGGPGQGLDTLWRFTQFAAVTQSAFHGEIKDGDAHGFRSGATQVGYVPKVQLSNRGMMRVIEQWRDGGFQHELDYYVAKDLFSRATDPKDRAYLYQQGQFKGFFKTEGWAQNPDYSPEALQRFEVKIPLNDAPPSDIVPAREVIESLYGEIPVRTVWPSGQDATAQETQNTMADFVSLEAELAAWKATWGDHLAAVAETHRLVSAGE